MEELTTIKYCDTEIRVYGNQNNPHFAGADIATALGYDNIGEALREVPHYEKVFVPKVGFCLTEFGVATLAKDDHFRQWISVEILPSIHSFGCVIPKRGDYERLYTLSNGETLNKKGLTSRAITFGMQKTEAKRSSVAKLTEYIENQYNSATEKEVQSQLKESFPYSYESVDEISGYNLNNLFHVLPEGSYVIADGRHLFNEEAVEAIKAEIQKWK